MRRRSLKKVQVKRTFMTSASRSSIFVESGSSLWRLTSNRSVLAASSGCFTSTDMVVSPQSTAQIAVVSRLKRALQERRQSNPWSEHCETPKNWAGTRSLDIQYSCIHYQAHFLFWEGQSETRLVTKKNGSIVQNIQRFCSNHTLAF